MAAAPVRSITLPSKIRLPTTREYMPEDPDDPLKMCPLVPAHRILSSRMALHLVKCREAQVLKLPLAQCKFDTTHWVPKKDLAYHMAEECDRRDLFYNYHQAPGEPCAMAVPYKPPELPQFEENWDDGPCVCYDPSVKAENEAVLRTRPVASKKERKRFRNSERRRLQELEREGKVLPGTCVKPPANIQPSHRNTVEEIACADNVMEKNLPVAASVGPATSSGIVKSLEKLNLETTATKNKDAWVCVGKARRRPAKKLQ